MKNFPLLCALAASMYQTPSLCAENTNIYKEAGYSFMGKSALVSTAVVIALATGYGLWAWWNKKPVVAKPVEQETTKQVVAVEPDPLPEAPQPATPASIPAAPAPTQTITTKPAEPKPTERASIVEAPAPKQPVIVEPIKQEQVIVPQKAAIEPVQPAKPVVPEEPRGPKTSTPTQKEASALKKKKQAAALELAEIVKKQQQVMAKKKSAVAKTE